MGSLVRVGAGCLVFVDAAAIATDASVDGGGARKATGLTRHGAEIAERPACFRAARGHGVPCPS